MAVKGVVFTLMAIVTVAFLLSSERVVSGTFTATKADADAAATRISVVNTFVETFEEHVANALSVAGYVALQNMTQKIVYDGTFIADINQSLYDCIVQNTLVLGSNFDCLPPSASLNESVDLLIQLAATELGITTNYFIHQLWVTEEEPFKVIFWANISYNLSDPFVSWVVDDVIVSTIVDVSGVEDPLHAYLLLDGNVTQTRVFEETPLKRHDFNIETFEDFYTNRSYISNRGKSPSVLHRYVGDVDASQCCGIESVVYWSSIPVGIQTDFEAKNWSYVDFLFMNRTIYNCGIHGAAVALTFPHDNLRIDKDRITNQYNLTNDATFSC